MQADNIFEYYWDIFIAHICEFHPLDQDFIDHYRYELDWHSLSKNKVIAWDTEFLDKFQDRLVWHELGWNESILWTADRIDKFKKRLDWYYLSRNRNLPISEDFIRKYSKKIFAVEDNVFLSTDLVAKSNLRVLPALHHNTQILKEIDQSKVEELLQNWGYHHNQKVFYDHVLVPIIADRGLREIFGKKFDYSQRYFFLEALWSDISGLTPGYEVEGDNPFGYYRADRTLLDIDYTLKVKYGASHEGPDRLYEILGNMPKILALLLLFFSFPTSAQDAEIFKPDSIKKELVAVKIATTLNIDGSMQETEWKMASPSPRFIQIEPLQGQAPNHETEVRVLYNRQYLYFGIFSRDSLGKKAIRATDFKRDFDPRQHDQLSLSFDGFNDQRNAMSFATNPYGLQRDFLVFDDTYYDMDWDGLWRVRTSRTDSGWVAEIAIPWQTLRYPKSADTLQHWGFNIYRNRRLTNEITAFSPYPRAFSALRMDYAGVLKNLQPPPPKPNIRIQPYFLTSYDHFKGFDPIIKPEQTKFKVGGDLKWAINPNTVLDLTANTDFAQADADRQVNNVTRFSVFFPERRQFFLENASLFGVGVGPGSDGAGGSMRIQPFFSRTIGLDYAGNPIPIDAGGRFVYRSSQRNYGAMLIRQRELGESPATNFFVGRFSENFGAQNRIGGLVTVKNHPGGTNVVSTVDGFFRLGESHSLNTLVMHSSANTAGKQGFAGIAQYYNSTNKYKIWWTESVVTKDFNPEMGFVARNDIIGTTPGMNWYYRGRLLPFKKLIRAFEPGFLPEFYHKASTGKLIESQLTFFPVWINFQNGSYFGYSVNPAFQRLTEPFEPLGVTIREGDYHYFRQQFWYTTDPSKIISLFGQTDWGSYFDGHLFSTDLTLQFAPLPHLSLAGRFNRNHFQSVGADKTTKNVDLYSIEGRFALNARLQLIGFYQKNTENKADNYNIRLAWEYSPLSYVYLVLNKRGFDDIDQIRRNEDHAVLKISYLKQF